MSGPDKVFIDARVARTMNQDAAGELDVAYIREDIAHARAAESRGREIIVQILTNPNGNLIGLSSWGRVFAFVSETEDTAPGWTIVADQLEVQGLDS
jgi:hypothetical protein